MRDCEEEQGWGSLLEGGGGRPDTPTYKHAVLVIGPAFPWVLQGTTSFSSHTSPFCKQHHSHVTPPPFLPPPPPLPPGDLCVLQAFLLSFMKLHWAVITLLVDRGPQGDPRLVLRAVQVGAGGEGGGTGTGGRGGGRGGQGSAAGCSVLCRSVGGGGRLRLERGETGSGRDVGAA